MGANLGLQLKAPTGEVIQQDIRLNFSASNKEAKHGAIIAGLDLAISVLKKNLHMKRLATSGRGDK